VSGFAEIDVAHSSNDQPNNRANWNVAQLFATIGELPLGAYQNDTQLGIPAKGRRLLLQFPANLRSPHA
jgi:hypothetical protein